jgi:type I restriction enzyme, S subunit
MSKQSWPLVRLGDFVSIKHGYPFKSEYMSHDQPEKPIVVGIGNFEYTGGFRFSTTKIKTYRGAFPSEFILKPNDILLVMTCQTSGGEILGIPGRIPDDGKVYLHNQRMGKVIIINKKKVSYDYLYWLFLLHDFNRYLAATASGAKILHTAPERIEAFKFYLPPLSIQHQIANILSAYNDLIENNTRRIAILEEMAGMLYEEWFVKFRFPGHEQVKMLESEMGLVPEGWKEVKLRDVADINLSSLQNSSDLEEIRYIDIASVSAGQINAIETIPFQLAPGRARRIVKHGDTIWSTVRPNRKSYSMILYPPENLIVSTGFAVIRARTIPYTYLYLATTTDFFTNYLVSRATGSAYPAVNTKDFQAATLLLPPLDLLKKFHMQIESNFLQKQILLNKNTNLRRTRDLLLPKLVTGEIDVSSWVGGSEIVEEVTTSVVDGVREIKIDEPIDMDATQQQMLWD